MKSSGFVPGDLVMWDAYPVTWSPTTTTSGRNLGIVVAVTEETMHVMWINRVGRPVLIDYLAHERDSYITLVQR